METLGIDTNKEEVNQRAGSLPKNNPNGSGYDCDKRCHEQAAELLRIATDRNYARFVKVEELK